MCFIHSFLKSGSPNILFIIAPVVETENIGFSQVWSFKNITVCINFSI